MPEENKVAPDVIAQLEILAQRVSSIEIAPAQDDGRVRFGGDPHGPIVNAVRPFPYGTTSPWALKFLRLNKALIATGDFLAGADPNNPYLTSVETTITISADPTWVGLRYNPLNKTLTVFNSGGTKPGGAHDGVADIWLYCFAWDGTNAGLVADNIFAAHASLFAIASTI